MAVTNNFSASSLDLNGQTVLSQPTALVWGPDGRLYVTEVDGDVRVLTIAFGDKDPGDGDPTASFYVTEAVTLSLIKGAIQNHNDNGTENANANRQVTGVDVTPQFDANGDPVFIDGKPAVTIYVTSSDNRIGAGGSGNDANLDTNSGVITKLTQTGPDTWTAVDIVRGLPRSEENHATNGLEVVQEIDPVTGKLVSERMIVASGGNANTGAPSNNFAGQQEQPLSAAILEVDLDMLKAMPVLDDAGRAYVYDIPTLNDPSRADVGGEDVNDPFGGNDGRNSAKLLADGPVRIYSPGYRNAYDVEVTEDGRVWTYDNGANNSWGGRPIGEAGDNGGAIDFAQALGYIATNLNNGEGNSEDAINLVNWNPSNDDNFHEVTRSDDLDGRALSAGQGGPVTYEQDGLTYVYGGHPNPTRAEGSRAGLLFSPGAGADNAFLLVSNEDSFGNGGGSDYDEVIAWLTEVENNDAAYPTTGIYGADPGELTNRVLAVTPGVLYDIYALAGGAGAAVVAGGPAPSGGTLLGQAGLPSDIAEIVATPNPIEGNYLEAGKTDGALDTGGGSINGLAEYTSTILDDGATKMSGAILATQLGGGNIIVMGRNADGSMSSVVSGGSALAADRTVIAAGGGPLGIDTVGDDYIENGLTQPFQGSIWTAVYNQNGPLIEIFQPNNGAVPLAGSEIVNPTDRDLDGVDYIADPFEFSDDNGYAIAPGETIVLDFNPQNTSFPTSLSGTGLLGAALDGETPNRDAQTAEENFPVDQQFDGLYDIGGNVLPGGNAPILQIKKVVAGTVVGAENSARDVLHTGVRPSPDTDRLVATVTAKNWIPEAGGAAPGQLTGMIFGDGTQANFVRFVFGSVNGQPGFEVGYEIGDANYVALAQVAAPGLSDVNVTTLELRLTIDMQDGFSVKAEHRLQGEADFTALDLGGFSLPAGVLQDVLTGAHTIGTGAAEQPSGAAFGFLAETSTGNDLEAMDFFDLTIEAFGNEILAGTAAEVGQPGSPNVDTVIYEGTETALAPLAADVENFDGSGSTADYAVTGNALDNDIRVGTGANTVTTGGGADVVRGTLAQLAGDEITDFSADDTVLIEGAVLNDLTVEYAAGSAVVIVNGQQITFSGPDFEDFQPADGPSRFALTQADDGVAITLVQAETILYRVNAGSNAGPAALQGTVAAIDGGPDWIGDAALIGSAGPISVTGATTNTYFQALTDAQNEIDPGNVDLSVTPWQLFVNERSDNTAAAPKLTYNFDVEAGKTYKITLYYTENWNGIFNFAANNGGNTRQFDVTVEGQQFAEFQDINPMAEAVAVVGGALPTAAQTNLHQQYLGVAFQRELTYTATDDVLTLEWEHEIENPKINAIQISVLGGPAQPPADTTPPVVESITVDNPQNVQDGTRTATVVLTDAAGFDAGDFIGLDGSELAFSGIVPQSVSAPSVALSNGGTTVTLTYTLAAAGNAWPSGVGQIAIAAGAFGDAAGNDSPAAQAAFVLQPNLANLVRGEVARAINVGTTDATAATNLGPDPLDGGAVDNNRYAGAIAADSLITDAAGNPVAFEADSNAYYTSPKSNAQLNANVDGQSGTTGSNSGGVDLDGSAYHTYRDSAADVWTATYDGFAPGVYIVELHFAELFQTTAGSRVGDFFINGQLVADDYDAFAQAQGGPGADKPSFIRVPVTVLDGAITVTVDSSAGQAGYSAIVVYEAADPTTPPAVSVADVAVAEGEDAQIVFTREGDPTEEITVTFTVAPNAPASAADYEAPSSFTAVIPAGAFASAPVLVPIVDDAEEEGAETLTVSITSVANASANATVADGVATVTIAASDPSLSIPVGATIFELDFEGAEGEALAVGGFDGTLGDEAVTLDEATSQVTGGKLVVQTSEGDINDGTDNGSFNDFTRTVDLSDPALTEIFLTTRFDNPFDQAFFDANGLSGSLVPNFAQQGILLGTGTQLAGEMVKLVWGGVAGGSQTGVQMWTKGNSVNQSATIGAMAPGVATQDVAAVEMSLRVDKTAGTIAQFVTLFDASGAVLGGTRPEATPGFATAAPVALPAAVLNNLLSDAAPTHVGVHSTDNSTPVEAIGSFEATWDFLRLSSPQFVAEPEGTDSVDGVVVGDFSDDGAAPTAIGELALGDNVIVATQQGDAEPGGRDRDYFTFTVAEGQVLSQLVLQGFETDDQGLPQAFMGIQAGPVVTTDPETFADAGDLLGGLIYNSGLINNDVLPELGDGEEQGVTFIGFDAPLPAGTYTVWLNQGGVATTATLNFVVAEAPAETITLSIADASPVVENGDAGDTLLVFPLTSSGPDATVTLNYTVNGVPQSTEVVFSGGVAALTVAVASDGVDNGPDTVDVVLTGVVETGFAIGAATATGVVTEDDAIDPADIDGDGILNIDDPFAYDGSNGDARQLVAGGAFTQDFNTDTTDPFSPEAGFTGILVNPAFDYGNPADPAADPYGNRTNEAGVSISGGTLNILSSETDAFPLTGTGTNNTQADAYQSAVDVTGVNSFEVHARASSAEWLAATAFNGFAQFGITLGAGGVDDFVKLVLSDGGNNPPRVQLAHNNSLVGGENNYAVNTSTGPTIDLSLIGDVEFRLIVDKAAGSVVGQVDFFAAADGALLESFETPPVAILPDGSLVAALSGANPLTGGDGGLAYGVLTSDWNAGDSNRITANFDFLTIRALDEVPNAPPAVADGIPAQTATEDAAFTLVVPTDAFADDGGAENLVLTATLENGDPLPAWLSFDGAVFSGAPGNDDVGVLSVKVLASDGVNLPAEAVFALTVENVNDAPEIAGAVDNVSVIVGVGGTVDLSGVIVSDIDADDVATLLARLASGDPLPAGLTLENGQIVAGPGLPVGDYAIELYAEDGAQAESVETVAFTLTVAEPAPLTVSVADAPTLVEAGDEGVTELVFPLTLEGGGDATLTIAYSVNDVEQTPVTIDFVAGVATLGVSVPNDALDNGDDAVTLALTDVAEAGFAADLTPAQGVVTEDDTPDPADIDGDGILNIDDPFAYDGQNGLGRTLTPGATFRQDFDVDTADVFSPEAGFTGVIVNPAFTPAGISGADPYGDRTTEATSLVEGGVLKVQSSIDDSFGAVGATGSTNILKDNYQSAVDVSGVAAFSVEGKANNVFADDFDGGIPTQYASYGISLGAGGVDDFVKFVVGGIGASASAKELRVEIGHQNSLVGAATAITLASAGIDKATQATIASVIFRIDVDVSAPTATSAGTLVGVATFLDGLGEVIGTITTPAREIDPAGSLAAAIAGENPLTGDVGGLAYGVSITHYNVAANQFTGEWDYLEITAPNTPPTVAPIDAGTASEDAAPVVIDLLQGASDADGGTLGVADVAVTDGEGAPVPFALEGASLTIDPAQFAAALAAGGNAVLTVAYDVVDGQGGATPNTATLTVEGLDGPFTFFRDVDGDGFGVDDAATNVSAYEAPAGFAADAGDADDADASIYPGAPEVNDGKDNDQDGQTDEDNQAPAPQPDAASVAFNGALTIAAADLLLNDTDPDLDPLTVVSVQDAVNGAVSLEDGVVTFTPTADYSGPASFTYTVSDGFGGVATATVDVTVVAPQPTVRLQAEDLALSGFFVVEAIAAADQGAGIRTPRDATGVATVALDGVAAPGLYDITVAYFDENDGVSEASLSVAGPVNSFSQDWLFDDPTSPSNGASAASLRTITFENVRVDAGASLSIQATGRLGEFARIDYVELVPVDTDPGPNLAPVASPIGDRSVQAGSTLSLDLDDFFTDPEGGALGYTVEGPAWLSIDPATGVLSGAPGAGDVAGDAPVTVTASDGVNQTQASFLVTVTPQPQAESIRIQAEDLTVDFGFFVENNAAADGSQVLRVAPRAGGEASIDLAGLVAAGVYQLNIAYFDESDGESFATVVVEGGVNAFAGDWTWDDDAASTAGPDAQSLRVRGFGPLTVDADATLRITLAADAAEFGRIDYIEFVLAQQNPDNDPPFAPFGVSDAAAVEETPVSIDLSAFFADPEDDPLTYTLVSGQDWLTLDPVTGLLTGLPDDAQVGATVVRVSVSDGNSAVEESFTLDVAGINDAPVSLGAASRTLALGSSADIDLAALFDDADGDPLSVSVVGDLPDGVTLQDGRLVGQPTVGGSFALTVTASDGQEQAEAPLLLTVLAVDPRPEVRIEAESFALAPGGFFVENQAAASGEIAGAGKVIRLLANRSGEATFVVGPEIAEGLYDARVTYFDENDGVSTAVLSASLDGGATFSEVGAWSFDATDGGDAAQPQSLRSRLFTDLQIEAGAILKLTAQSQGGEFGRIDFIDLVPSSGGANFAPTPLGIDDAETSGLFPVSIDLSESFADPEDDPITFSLVSGPAWVSVSPEGILTGTPDAFGAFEIVIAGTDGPGGSGVTLQQGFTLTVIDDDAPPQVVSPLGDITLAEGELVEVQAGFVDPEGGALTYSLADGAPDWLSVDPTLGVLSGTPGADDAGVYLVGVVATDPAGKSTTDTATITVTDVNQSPFVAAPLGDVSLDGLAAFSFAVPSGAFDDPDLGVSPGETLVLSATLADGSPLPAWIAFDPATGVFSGVAAPGQTLEIAVTATDAGGLAATSIFTLESGGGDVARPSIVIEAEDFTGLGESAFLTESVSTASGDAGIRLPQRGTGAVSTDLAAVGAIGSYVATVRFIDETDGVSSARLLVDGVEVGSWLFNGTAGVKVTPAAGAGNSIQAGNYREITFPTAFTVGADSVLTIEAVADSGEFARFDLVTLTPADSPPALDAVAFDAAENQTVAAALSATDPDGGPVALSIAGTGADDALFTLVDGQLVFASAPNFEAPGDADLDGVYLVDIAASSGGAVATQTVAITVTDVNDAPVAGPAPTAQSGAVGAPAALPDAATLFDDEDAGAVLTFTADGLPAGVTLVDGVFTGAPTEAGAFLVTVEASDGVAPPVSVSFDLVVSAEPDPGAPAGALTDDLDGDGVANAADPDIDGDGLLNGDDPFAYDSALDGHGVALEAGGSLVLEFDTPGSPFQNGITGVLQGAPGFTGELDYATNDGAVVVIENGEGKLVFETTKGDTGGSDNPQRDFTFGARAEGDLRFEGVIENPWFTAPDTPVLNEQLGLVVGVDSDAFVKLVFGNPGANIELSQESAPTGQAKQTAAFPGGLGIKDFAKARLEFEIDVTGASATITGFVTLLDAAGAALGARTLVSSQAVAGPLLAALIDPDAAVAFGVTSTHFGASPDPFTVKVERLALFSTETPVVDPDPVDPALFAPGGDLDGDTVVNASDPDVDGDGLANADDPFAYDAQNGRLLAAGETIALDFSTDGTPYQNGLTGLLQAGVPGSSALAAFNEDTGTAVVSGGKLLVTASNGDTGTTNSPEDDFQLGVKNRAFTLEGRVDNPFQTGGAANFDQLGLHVGIDSTDFVKFVFGFAGGTVEFSKRENDVESKAGGANQPLPAGLTLADFAAVDIRLEVSASAPNAATVAGFATFLDAAGQPIAGATNVSFGSLPVTGALAAALFDETVGVGAGFTQTQVGGTDAPFVAALDSLSVTAPQASQPPVDPTGALEAFASQGDLETGASYAGGTIGAAVLTVNAGSNDIDASNFGANSFQVTNTGGKKISAIFIDARTSLYPDQVFDPDGAGGDAASKPWAVNSAGGTGGFVTGTGYFLPGDAPLPNTTGTGIASNGGFKGAMVKFNPNVDGGFETGETVGFSGDMDTNSIAGLNKGGTTGVDTGAILSWDVGGVSGHELIGSLFTVLFDDGSTASGQLASDGSDSGSVSLATQAAAAAPISLTVNGTPAGGTGTYGGSTPSVIVSGEAGQLVRVTLTKGFNPVSNDTSGVADLVEARLASQVFAANNAFDSQSVEVVIGADGTFDASALFDYDDAPANEKGSFAGDDVAQIGFVAVPLSGGLPAGPVTAPIYLSNVGGPVVGDPTPPEPEGYFSMIGSGSSARFKVQFEDPNGPGGTNPDSNWTFFSAADANGNQSGFQGQGYYLWGSETSTSLNNPLPDSFLSYDIFVPEGEGGVFTFRVRASRDSADPSDQRNDIWLRIDGDAEAVQVSEENTVSNNGFVKLFGTGTGGWGFGATLDSVEESVPNYAAQFVLSEGLHTITFAGRSQGYHVDYWEAYKGGAPAVGASNSAFVEGAPGDGGGGEPPVGAVFYPIDASSDDWEQFGAGGSSDLEFGLNGPDLQSVGLRFDDVDIPAGAVLEDAYFLFQAFETSSGAANFLIEIQGSEAAATYSTGSTPDARTYVDSFEWLDVEGWTLGQSYRTPDISELIETVVGVDGVTDGALGFRVTGTGSRVAHSFDSAAGTEPQLVLVFADDPLV